jgi:hypothetical protein
MTAFSNVNHSFKFIGFFYSVTQLSYFIVSYLHKVSIKSPFIKEISPLLAFDNSLTKLAWF